MPDFGAPVAQNINPPNAFQTLSQVLGVQQARQNLQTGQYVQQQQQAGAQNAQQQMQERQLLQQTMMSGKDPDGNPIRDATGQINSPALSSFVNKYLPLTGQAVNQNIIKTQDDQLKLKDSLRGLNQNYKNDISGIVQSWNNSGVTPDQMNTSLDAYAQANPEAQNAINRAKAFIPNIAQTANDPQMHGAKIRQLTQEFQPTQTTAAQQNANIQATTGQNGGVQLYQANPLSSVPTGAVGQEIAQGIPLSERQTLGQNPLTGGPVVINKSGQGSITGITNPPTQGVYVPQPGDKEALPGLQAERDTARQQYSSAGIQHNNNQIVLNNIDNVGATGVAGQGWRNIAGAFGFRNGDANDSATAYDLVGKGLERSALQASQSMGPQTNAGLEAQIKANGNLAYTPQAIKEITKLNDSLVSGTQAYQPGLERAISANPSAGVFAKRQFDQAWGANFDPNIFRYYNAIKSGDKTEQQTIVKQLGGMNSAAYKEMMRKAQNLQQLSNSGSLGQP